MLKQAGAGSAAWLQQASRCQPVGFNHRRRQPRTNPENTNELHTHPGSTKSLRTLAAHRHRRGHPRGAAAASDRHPRPELPVLRPQRCPPGLHPAGRLGAAGLRHRVRKPGIDHRHRGHRRTAQGLPAQQLQRIGGRPAVERHPPVGIRQAGRRSSPGQRLHPQRPVGHAARRVHHARHGVPGPDQQGSGLPADHAHLVRQPVRHRHRPTWRSPSTCPKGWRSRN